MTRTDSSQGRPAFEQAPAEIWRLLPREHGAYAQVIFPLLTALALGDRSAPQFLWAAASMALFVAHEPLLILAGERGRRSHAELREHAQKLAAILSLIAFGAGALGWWHAPQAARVAVIVPLGFGVFLLPLIINHHEKSLPGELLASVTFSTMLLPIALAGGVGLHPALIASAVWSAIFSLGTFMVRAVIANVKKSAPSRWPVYASNALGLAAILASFTLLLTHALPVLAAAAILPAALITLACNLVGVHPRHLRKMGWSLVASNVIALAALIIGLR
jgi:hypothetical protein